MNRPTVLAIAAIAALLVAPAFAGAADKDNSVKIKLGAMNGSNETGTATLIPKGEKTTVVIDVANAPKDPQPAHFHLGTCDKYNPHHEYNLEAVVDGKSTTTLDAPVSKLVGGDMVINVHKSAVDVATISACAIVKAPS
jgi:Cu/Zn superoxide dismutase